jgi:cystathionine beta-synthase
VIHDDMIGTIGNTPLVRLQRVARGLACEVVAKIEATNPAGSVKDRTAQRIVADAERRGLLKRGGTIVESTSGNMGVGLAFVAAVRGYRCVVVTTDKQSEEKINLVRAFGAEVRVCPTAVEPDDPRSFYSVAKKIAGEIPGAFLANQFHNPENPAAHEHGTGPEIWRQTDGRVDAIVGGLGTGGTICGAGKFLKSKNPKVKVVGVDPAGSLFYDWFHTHTMAKAQMYKIEGIGEDILPSVLDFSVLDDVVRVHDRESFVAARRLAREEGILAGGSGGAALVGTLAFARSMPAGSRVVMIVPERGERALGKVYNDEWMRRNQYLDEGPVRARDLLARKSGDLPDLVTLPPTAKVADAIRRMQDLEVSQIPIVEGDRVLGTVREEQVVQLLLQGPDGLSAPVRDVMSHPVPEVAPEASAEEVQRLLLAGGGAVLVRGEDGRRHILTKHDLLHGLVHP